MQARTVDVSEGLSWYSCGWKLFTKSWAIWIALIVLFGVIGIVLSFIPLLGPSIFSLIAPALTAGLYTAARACENDQKAEPMMLFAGLRDGALRMPLLTMGVLVLAVNLIFILLLGGSMWMSMSPMTGPEGPVPHMGAGVMIGSLLFLAVQLAIAMSLFYAVPLVTFQGVPVVDAMKSSVTSCLKNFLPLLVFGVIYFVLGIIAALPFFLGFLVLGPVTVCAAYCSYRSIYRQ